MKIAKMLEFALQIITSLPARLLKNKFCTHAKDDTLNFCKGLKGQRKSCLI